MVKIGFITPKELNRIQDSEIPKFEKLQLIADMCRLNTLSAIKMAGSGHLGSSLSAMDIFVMLYFSEINLLRIGLRNPDRDIFFSSKGHDVPGQYAAMVAAGIISFDKLLKLRRLEGLDGHPDVGIPGMEANTGSLGMGISKAKGIAWAKKLNKWSGRVFVLTGDGELQEGQVWESLQTTAHQQIHNLIVIVDANKVQTDKTVEEIVNLRNLEDKFRAFGWYVERCNGHNFQELDRVFARFKSIIDQPKILIADTIKGMGVSFMEHPQALKENNGIYRWHSGAPDNQVYEVAYQELVSKINDRLDQLELEPIMPECYEPDPSAIWKTSNERLVTAYGEALVELASRRRDIVVLDADLAADCGLVPFQKAFPERFIENGIAEQDMVSTAGGLALQGLLPIVNSFGVFLASRANEQVYNNATENTKIIYVCHYAGLIPAGPGKSHQSLRDLSLFGALPNCIMIEPCNGIEAKSALEWCVNQARENCLLRLVIVPSPRTITLPDRYKFTFGKGIVLRDGTDAIIFTYGPVMLNEALVASELLTKKNFSLKVVNMPWLNRIDKDWFEEVVDDCRTIFVLDNHAPVGGLGDFLLNALNESQKLNNRKFYKFAVEGYPACGTPVEALRFHKLDGESLAKRVLESHGLQR